MGEGGYKDFRRTPLTSPLLDSSPDDASMTSLRWKVKGRENGRRKTKKERTKRDGRQR